MAELVWVKELMTPARALELAGDWPVTAREGALWCDMCGGHIEHMCRTTPLAIVSATLRHAVIFHDQATNDAAKGIAHGREGAAGEAAAGTGDAAGGHGDPAGRRGFPAQAASGDGGAGTQGDAGR